MFKEEEGIPLPPRGLRYSASVRALNPGKSVHLPTTTNTGYSICAVLYSQGERERGEFRIRKEADASGKGIRIWRRPAEGWD